MDQSIPTSTHKLLKGVFKLSMYKVTVNIYIVDVMREVSETMRKLHKKYKLDYSDVNPEACGYTCTFPNYNPNVYYVILCRESMDINTITHEVDHLRNFILDDQGITETDYNKEVSANLAGFLNEKTFQFLQKNNITIKY